MNAPSTPILSAGVLTLLVAGASLDLLPLPATVAATDQLSMYALLSRSKLTDDCPVCDRLPIQVPMQGTFTLRLLEQTPLFARYAIENISFVASNANFGRIYTVKGGNHLYGDDPLVAASGRYFLSLGGTPNGQGFGLIVDLDSPVA